MRKLNDTFGDRPPVQPVQPVQPIKLALARSPSGLSTGPGREIVRQRATFNKVTGKHLIHLNFRKETPFLMNGRNKLKSLKPGMDLRPF